MRYRETIYQYPSEHISDAIRCTKYKLDERKPKIYQTFQLPFAFQHGEDASGLMEKSGAELNDGNLQKYFIHKFSIFIFFNNSMSLKNISMER